MKVNPDLKDKNVGLLKIRQFLQNINAEESENYNRIDDIFISPTEYDQIKSVLEKNRIVFITGTKENGKTYTAIRLLWEYFKNGYEPKWFSHEEIMKQSVREKTTRIRNILQHRNIILLDDLFGKTEYENNEDLERNFRTIIDTVRNTDDVYLIVTSREDIFKDFIDITNYDPNSLEVKMNIKNPSYTPDKRMEMVVKWAKADNCLWLNNGGLRNLILETVYNNKTKLATTLNIKDFAYSSKNVATEKEIIDRINEKSADTDWSFAQEIKRMSDDKILFLSFPFISFLFPIDLIKSKFNSMVDQLKIDNAWEFSKLVDYFKEDKLDISSGFLRFSHPSYSEAFRFLLKDNKYPSSINKKILSPVLCMFAKENIAKNDVAKLVADNFEKFTIETIDTLVSLLGGEIRRSMISHLIKTKLDIKSLDKRALELLGKEGLFFLKAIVPNDYKIDEAIHLVGKAFDWNILWNDSIEHKDEVSANIFDILLYRLSKLCDLKGIHLPFHGKLTNRIIDSKLKAIIVEKDISVDEIINNITEDKILVEQVSRIGSTISIMYIKKRLEHLRKIRLIVSYKRGEREFVRARMPLLYRVERQNKVYPQEKIQNYISSVSNELKFYERIKRYAYEIVDKIKFHPDFEGREPKRISAAILNVACQMYGLNQKRHISYTMGVNPNTTSKLSKMIICILNYDKP